MIFRYCRIYKDFWNGISIYDEEETLELIRKVGIGGSFLQEENTLFNHRKFLEIPELFDHTLSRGLQEDMKMDALYKARDKVEKILLRKDLYSIDEERSRLIDTVVEKADKSL